MSKKILSIDGGGIKGVFPASFLSTIEELTEGKDIAEYFDLIIGTSTGGIIALGLGLGFKPSEILSFYERWGEQIFRKSCFVGIQNLFSSKYSRKSLEDALIDTFKDKKLGLSRVRLVIPSLNMTTGEVHLYKTAHHTRLKTDYKETAVNVAMATTAAPTYFPVHYSPQGSPLADGGIWANNPIAIAAVEGIGVLGWRKDDIQILSVSCTSEPFKEKKFGGRWFWRNQVPVFLHSQSSSALGMASHLIGKNNIFRIDPILIGNRYKMDAIDQKSTLIGLGRTEARKAFDSIRHFFIDKTEQFKPHYTI